MKNKYDYYEIYSCPAKPTDNGNYLGKTPVLEQAVGAVELAKKQGQLLFIA